MKSRRPRFPLPPHVLSIVRRCAGEIARFFHGTKGSHDLEHTLRVLALAAHIAANEKADMTVVQLAALLHDIGREEENRSRGKICHARCGKSKAAAVLKKIPLSETQRSNVLHCIESHRFRGAVRPRTLEARVLFDADKLDSIGAVGIGRAFLFAGEIGAKLHAPGVDVMSSKAYSEHDTAYREYRVKLRRIQQRMYTGEGRRLARARHEFMAGFFKRFLDEVEGRC